MQIFNASLIRIKHLENVTTFEDVEEEKGKMCTFYKISKKINEHFVACANERV